MVDAKKKAAINTARRVYRITEVALYRAEREGRHTAVERLNKRLKERYARYLELSKAAF